jgi:hypothetical protein
VTAAREHVSDGGQGLALLGDLSRAHGGALTLTSLSRGTGTLVQLVVPTQRGSEV